MKRFYSIAFLGLALFASIACAKKDPADDSQKTVTNPKDLQGMPPEKKDLYCFLFVEPETKEIAAQMMGQLGGTWTHYPAGTEDDRRKVEFNLNTDQHLVAVTEYYDFGHNVDNINFSKTCVSKELGQDMGAFAGYRVFQFMATDGEGGAALLIKWVPAANEHSNASIKVSDRYYVRYATNILDDLSNLMKSSATYRVRTYTDHK